MSDTGLTKVNYLSYWIHILPNATSAGHSVKSSNLEEKKSKKRMVCGVGIRWEELAFWIPTVCPTNPDVTTSDTFDLDELDRNVLCVFVMSR